MVNHCIETYLHCFASSKLGSWAKFLSWAEYWYNTSFHSATQTTPFRVVYGWEPPPLISGTPTAFPNSEVDTLLQDRDIMIIVLWEQLLRAQQRMKTAIERHRRDMSFEVGDSVYLKFQPYRRLSLARRLNENLAPIFYSPFWVLQLVGKVTYKLRLPPSSNIHPVFHISQLQPAIGNLPPTVDLSSQLSTDLELLLEPKALLGYRVSSSSSPHDIKVLIQWKDVPAHDATWEPYTLIQNQFPSFHLESKVTLGARGINKPPIYVTYSRRKQLRGT